MAYVFRYGLCCHINHKEGNGLTYCVVLTCFIVEEVVVV